MKTCAKCGRAYTDDTLNYCLEDGNPLAGGAAEAPTLAFVPGESGPVSNSGVSADTDKSVAVLPFSNMSDDPANEYFCDGLAEELLYSLARIEGLKVAARTSSFSFKNKNVDVTEIGRALRVRSVLEGSVRKSGTRLRITAQLIDVTNGYHLWTDRFDREDTDIFNIQDEITAAIVDALKLKLLGDDHPAPLKRSTEDPEAHRLYLKGRYHWNKYSSEGLQKAIEHFRQAIDIDPTYARAYAGLADSYVLSIAYAGAPKVETTERARAAAIRAIELDDELAEGHAALGMIKTFYDWDWIGAERDLQRAIDLNPNFSLAHQYLGIYYCAAGRFEESTASYRRAMDLDPLSVGIAEHQGWPLYYSRRFDEAITKFRTALDLNPDFPNTHFRLGLALLQKGLFDEARSEIERALTLGKTRQDYAWLGYLYARQGNKDKAVEMLSELQTRFRDVYVPPYFFALIHLELGERDKALEYLHRSLAIHDYWLIFIKVDPMIDELRSDRSFKKIEQQVGWP